MTLTKNTHVKMFLTAIQGGPKNFALLPFCISWTRVTNCSNFWYTHSPGTGTRQPHLNSVSTLPCETQNGQELFTAIHYRWQTTAWRDLREVSWAADITRRWHYTSSW